ncbi:F0F1 ATP synthase subunit gamma [Desulfobaculum bizertense]|uniref:F-type H+-transporting ATPase subunit gamma n=1 Tax=Desulfobaculum bizertense DSM 18034 TaxID=1121442 RepID=A0A1T4WCP1_9BACT|nr:F0F1 ATP synthase subunit gamma [Desulfobaculum bizertense]UIJ37430.1 F0F1 ATP synthase subunit gamma [Desulfobaculum bizertense]SKA74879.1 F-type H+-transporting ATPase subunit gamma [Desulfobaculum bizertense DSM 18034]
MLTLEGLEKRIGTAGSLLSVVTSMKNLAAVNMRQFEKAVESLSAYDSVTQQGWAALLRNGGLRTTHLTGAHIVLAVGTDQGLCGAFNELVSEHVLSFIDAQDVPPVIFVSGERLAGALEDARLSLSGRIPQPAGLPGIAGTAMAAVRGLPVKPAPLTVVYNRPASGGGFECRVRQVLPLNRDWAESLGEKPWPRRNLPMIGVPKRDMFSALFRQHLFISLYRAFGHSMAAENAARLAAMQRAEKNIEEMRDELAAQFRELRQNMITAELLEVASGFEALGGDTDVV